ncbi:MAG: twin-arginine translocase TatA/TatE family subunit [Planctomycetaceae bacterium]|nr:twin-arginine translocase TatA/TatE family subunit [Planctomycetaceae bacterium]
MAFETLISGQASLIGLIGVPGPLELVVLGLIILLLFGKRLPDLMGSLGRSIVEFKKGARELEGPEHSDADHGN